MPHVIRTGKIHHIIKVDDPRQPEPLYTWANVFHARSENLTVADTAESIPSWALHHV